MADDDLNTAPNVTCRALVQMARAELCMVIDYGMGGIHDKIDREHLAKAYLLLRLALDETSSAFRQHASVVEEDDIKPDTEVKS